MMEIFPVFFYIKLKLGLYKKKEKKKKKKRQISLKVNALIVFEIKGGF